MAWTTLAKAKTHLGIASGDTSQDAQLQQWLSQGHQLLVKEISQEVGNTIEAISVADPTVITCRGHGYYTGDTVSVSGSNSTPSIDGQQTVTVIDDDTFSVPVDVTVAGTAGWINHVFADRYYSGDGTKFLAIRERPVISVQSVYYDANGFFGKAPAPADPFNSTTELTEGSNWVLYIDNDREQVSERGHISRIDGTWLRPNARSRGTLVNMVGSSLGNLKVSYTSGRRRCPLDLQLAEQQLLAVIRAGAERGMPLASESLDYYQYQLAGQADAVKMLGGIYKALANYKEWRL